MQRKYALLRECAYEEGRASFDALAADPTFRDFVCLYIAEGYKRSRNTAAISNSDPVVMSLADRWMRRLATRALAYSIQCDTLLRARLQAWMDCLRASWA